jgi:hypothetical protein
MYNSDLQCEGRVIVTNGWEGQFYEMLVDGMNEKWGIHQKAHLHDQVTHPTIFRVFQRLLHYLAFDRVHRIP